MRVKLGFWRQALTIVNDESKQHGSLQDKATASRSTRAHIPQL